MASEDSYKSYYVPHNSRLPIMASIGIFLTVYGIANILNAIKADTSGSFGNVMLVLGALTLGFTLFIWFSTVIAENHARMYSDQMNRSFVWAMSWFIFSEIMFFVAFFGTLFYVRVFTVDWIAGVGDRGPSGMLWPEYSPEWPLLNNPDPARFPGAREVMSPWGLPLINTVLLVTSSVTVTFAHHGINEGNRKKIINWLAATVAPAPGSSNDDIGLSPINNKAFDAISIELGMIIPI